MVLPRRFAHRRRAQEGMCERPADDYLDELVVEKTDVGAAQRAARSQAAEDDPDWIAAVLATPRQGTRSGEAPRACADREPRDREPARLAATEADCGGEATRLLLSR